MLIRLLGPIVVTFDDGSQFVPPSSGQRKLLALLAIRDGRPVAADTICDLFHLTPGAVRTSISRLRKALGERLVTESQGYSLRADTDVQHFQRLVTEARTASPAQSASLRIEALALFRESALGEFSDELWARPEVTRLNELRSAVVEDLVDADIAAGHFDRAIDELHRHVRDHPYRDRPHELMMRAFALSGRHVEALRMFQSYRERLIDEVGVDPGEAIVELDRRIASGELTAESPGDAAAPTAAIPGSSQRQSNLYFPPNEFVGREAEIEAVGQAVANSRLVTLLGPGGVGKTRLSYQVAAEQLDSFADGVWVAEFVDCEDGDDAVQTIASVLGLTAADTAEACADQLSGHELLLVLDNCEHLAADLVHILDVLLSRTARLTLLATSRVRLGAVGEHTVSIAPLRTDGEAQDLFVRRATASGAEFADSDMQAIGDICERLDGIPLALELAAASSRILSPGEMLERLDDRFALFKGGPRGSVAGRHESLRAAVDSSYEHLHPETQRFFRRIAVFSGDFPLAGAEAAAAGLELAAVDLLTELVDRSLLTMQPVAGRSRYRLLETLRQYGEDRLRELGEFDEAIELHARWCLDHAAKLATRGFGASEVASLNELVAMSANMRVAISRLLDAGDSERAVQVALHVADYSYASNQLAGLARPLVDAGIAAIHPLGDRLQAMELIRRASATGTSTRVELARSLAQASTPEDDGTIHLSVLLIATALSVGPGDEFMEQVIDRAATQAKTAEAARLLCAAGLGSFYSANPPQDLELVERAMQAAQQAGMKRLTVAAASMACIAGLRLDRPLAGAQIARPVLGDLAQLGHPSIMSNGLIAMYTEASIQANESSADHLAAIELAGPNLRGDFNRLGQALSRLVQHHGRNDLAVRALGACDAANRSGFSTRQRTTILEQAALELTDRQIEELLAAGAVSEPTELYREMWSVLSPLMGQK